MTSAPSPASPEHLACVALGSNLGNRAGNLDRAVAMLLAAPGVFEVRVAPAFETAPVDCPPDAGAFLNTAASVRTSLDPLTLFALLQSIERSLGRERTVRNASRTIDLDLLLFDDLVLDTPGLTLPHPRMHVRRFVLEPLARVAGEVVHPVLHQTIRQLLDQLDASG
jgi:2-amino-4-hydroxy-6-hydroxymethyldihydropteridine diphosphokinase